MSRQCRLVSPLAQESFCQQGVSASPRPPLSQTSLHASHNRSNFKTETTCMDIVLFRQSRTHKGLGDTDLKGVYPCLVPASLNSLGSRSRLVFERDEHNSLLTLVFPLTTGGSTTTDNSEFLTGIWQVNLDSISCVSHIVHIVYIRNSKNELLGTLFSHFVPSVLNE